MRRFTPLAASPAIDNYWIETREGNRKKHRERRIQPYPLRVALRSEDLRSPVTAFSAARLISDA
jgi:hypothetical protein